ncbi:hypothetical protein I316_02237 [Kwoniella heveanensis BCC8398]|uniref:WSC domain-containing protein n=1 Tax=Kwoniella heveanensis BCC8398 TaxID=1296120 RepID=A0A1B9GXI5_9TREE|nr:hypothetical protein I316_02237 [Kwoniella heveanensis BCC8398]
MFIFLSYLPLTLFAFVSLLCPRPALADNLFIGCGDELIDYEMIFTTPSKNVCHTMCKTRSYEYYTHRADEGECMCYTYPPNAGAYIAGGPGSCGDDEMQYNIIKSSWSFEGCFPWFNMTMKPSDSFKACMDGCTTDEFAIAQPTGDFPGYTNCACAKKSDIVGVDQGEGDCDYERFYVYTHVPTPVPTTRRAKRALVIARRRAWQPRGPY